jgi:hypothetical protein
MILIYIRIIWKPGLALSVARVGFMVDQLVLRKDFFPIV